MAEIRTCVDRILPGDMFVEAAGRALDEDAANAPMVPVRPGGGVPRPTPLELAGLTTKKWKAGRTLRVAFLDGEQAVQQKVEALAKLWEDHANITLDFGADPDAEIRISFEQEGSWSYLGTDAKSIDRAEPTMNFGWLTTESEDEEYERVVVHEFGHALFCIHEHQNPGNEIPWDKEAVYRYYEGPPNNWTRDQVDNNLFRRYGADQTQFSAFDRKSIMLYPIPNQFTVGDFEVGLNSTLSDTDREFIGRWYPRAAKSDVELAVDGDPVQASIGAQGEEDVFRFTAASAGSHTIETSGATDVVVGLFGPDDDRNLLAADDDSGVGRNALMSLALVPGSYLVRVRHFSRAATGEYSISVRR